MAILRLFSNSIFDFPDLKHIVCGYSELLDFHGYSINELIDSQSKIDLFSYPLQRF